MSRRRFYTDSDFSEISVNIPETGNLQAGCFEYSGEREEVGMSMSCLANIDFTIFSITIIVYCISVYLLYIICYCKPRSLMQQIRTTLLDESSMSH